MIYCNSIFIYNLKKLITTEMSIISKYYILLWHTFEINVFPRKNSWPRIFNAIWMINKQHRYCSTFRGFLYDRAVHRQRYMEMTFFWMLMRTRVGPRCEDRHPSENRCKVAFCYVILRFLASVFVDDLYVIWNFRRKKKYI